MLAERHILRQQLKYQPPFFGSFDSGHPASVLDGSPDVDDRRL
jgi:hypothetical protein